MSVIDFDVPDVLAVKFAEFAFCFVVILFVVACVGVSVVFASQHSLMIKADSTAAVLHFEMACRHSDLNEIANVFSPFKLQSCTLSTSNMLISSRQAQPSTGESEEHSFIFAANLSATS